jgi:transposase
MRLNWYIKNFNLNFPSKWPTKYHKPKYEERQFQSKVMRYRRLPVEGTRLGFTASRRVFQQVKWVMIYIGTYLLRSHGNGIGSLKKLLV